MGGYAVRVRRQGDKRHRLVGRTRLTRLWIHAISFKDRGDAKEHAEWLLDNNRGKLDSGQVVTFGDGKVLDELKPKATA